MQEIQEKNSDKIRRMAVGDTISFPPESLNGIRVFCSTYSFQTGRKYRVHARRTEAEKYVEVIRTL